MDNNLTKASFDINHERNASDNNKTQNKFNKNTNSQINQNSNVHYNLKLNKNEKFEYIDRLRNELIDLEIKLDDELLNYSICKKCTEIKNQLIEKYSEEIARLNINFKKQLSSFSRIIENPKYVIQNYQHKINLLNQGIYFNNTKCRKCSYKQRVKLNLKIKHTKDVLNSIMGR